MRRKVIIILGAAVLAIGALPARAQTFPSYGCADGTKFIVGFYPYDKRAHIQLDGRARDACQAPRLVGRTAIRVATSR